MFNQNKLQVLIYHRVLNEHDILRSGEMKLDLFDKQMKTIAQYFNVLSLEDGLSRLSAGTLPSRAVAITFDDGYKDNLMVALPVLKKYNLHATIFIATGFLNGGIMWNDAIIELIRHCQYNLDLTRFHLGRIRTETLVDKLNAIQYLIQSLKYCVPVLRDEIIADMRSSVAVDLPVDLMLTVPELKVLANSGIDIGAHTVTHPILNKLSLEDAKTEIVQSKLFLEDTLGRKLKYFAYPNGNPGVDYQLSHRHFLKEVGFEAAFSTWRAAISQKMDVYQLPRFTPWDENVLKFCLRMFQYRFK